MKRKELSIIAAFVVALGAIFAIAYGAGAVFNTTDDSSGGYRLADVRAESGAMSFQVAHDSAAVTAFDTEHDKQLHLIVVRSDTAQFHHLHPTMAPDGTWSVPWTWPTPGRYRVIADTTPTGGGKQVLTQDVTVPGRVDSAPIPAPNRVADVDGYRVELGGSLSTAGGPLRLTVTRDGQPVTTLQPYLGAFGHLVVLRTGDLEYLHVHPTDGPQVTFHAQAPSAGTYRLFFEFQTDNTVHRAEFTTAAVTSTTPSDGHEHGHGHN